jgi:acid phosphatase
MFNRAAKYLILFYFLVTALEVRAAGSPEHFVVVIMENHAYSQIIGSANAPYINKVLVRNGALLTASFGVEHPSQPNYLDLFSGSNQGVTDDARPATLPFSTPNLGAKLIAAGRTFATYSETLPSVGFNGDSYTDQVGVHKYQRKHNPAANWQANDAPANNHLPAAVNRPFSDFPTTDVGYDALPTVSFVVPNEQHDMHDGTITAADTWLYNNLEGYRRWAMTHHSVLLLTFDEDDHSASNHITTIFVGQPIIHGAYSEAPIEPSPGAGVNHYNILRTIERRYLLGYCNAATDGTRKAISNIFRTAAPAPAKPLDASTR